MKNNENRFHDIENSITNSLVIRNIKLNERQNPVKIILVVSFVLLVVLGIIFCIVYFTK